MALLWVALSLWRLPLGLHFLTLTSVTLWILRVSLRVLRVFLGVLWTDQPVQEYHGHPLTLTFTSARLPTVRRIHRLAAHWLSSYRARYR
jgi:hypothetical protein